MILNDHNIPHFVVAIESTCCIRDNQSFHTQQEEDSHGVRHLEPQILCMINLGIILLTIYSVFSIALYSLINVMRWWVMGLVQMDVRGNTEGYNQYLFKSIFKDDEESSMRNPQLQYCRHCVTPKGIVISTCEVYVSVLCVSMRDWNFVTDLHVIMCSYSARVNKNSTLRFRSG